jgi:asparagine synthase (glutamine-hydrolysing)
VPGAILDRRKQGFGVPLDVWFRGRLTGMFADILGSARAKHRGYFQPAFVSRIVQEHLSGRRDHTLRLWQLLVLELWHRHYVDSPVVPAARAS